MPCLPLSHTSVDPARIFAFVRDESTYEAYRGSLRGARGTLWSGVGNSLDRASLLVALLRGSGFNARYVRGALSQTQARQLILSMLNTSIRVVGCPPVGEPTPDPAGRWAW